MRKRPPTAMGIINPEIDFEYKGRRWFVIDWERGLKRFKNVLKHYHIYEQSDTSRDVFVTFGYKILTAGEKETFFLIRDLALLSEKNKNEYQCIASQEYLATILGTSREQQSRRIKKLVDTGLVRTNNPNSLSNANVYLPVRWALPDSTLLSTLVTLIRRKRLYQLCGAYKDPKLSPEKKDEILKYARKLLRRLPNSANLITGPIKHDL